MKKLIPVKSPEDIFPEFIGTPVESLLRYHNLSEPLTAYERAVLVIGSCMDHRKKLRMPEKFAYVIRTGGGNLRFSEFALSYAIAVGEISHVALIGHDDCGMMNLFSKKDKFVHGLVERAGWEKETAEDHFMHFAPLFEIGNEMDFLLSETKRLNARYPKITVAPIFYNMQDNLLYLVEK